MMNLKTFTSVASTIIFLVLSYSVLVIRINGYSLKDCTVKGSLTSETMKVLCYKRKLNAVPQSIPCRARVLDISYNQISVIRKNDLKELSNLQFLNVSTNRIEDVEEGAFRGLVALRDLNLAHNKLTMISGGFFQNLFNLTVLRLEENLISNINSSAFLPLISLVMLNLSGNHLSYIHKAQPVFQMPLIQELHIGRNGFSSFETRHVSNASLQLKVLDLSHNPLQLFRITADIFPHLETLDIAFNNVSIKWDVHDKNYFRNVNRLNLSGIQMASAEMKDLLQTFNSTLSNLRLCSLGEQKVKPLTEDACLISSLETLRLESNSIGSISENELKNCTNLRVLDLAENSLIKIPPLAFKSMKKLNMLGLCHNKLSHVPPAITNLSTLEILDLSYNSITSLKCIDFSHLTQLLILHIYRNPLTSVEHCAFQDLQNLKTLLIGSNRLFTLKGYLTNGLKNLKNLDTTRNKLNTIHRGDLEGLKNLSYLHLQDNQIKTIEDGAFEGLQNLILLELQSNKLTQTSLRSSLFSGLTNLKELVLNNNFITFSSHNSLKQPPFINLKSLHTLAIFSQGKDGMMNFPSNFLQGLISLKILWAGNLNLNSLHPETFTYTPKLQLLDLSKNYLTSISFETFLPVKALTSLTMIQTGIQSLDFLIQANLNQIKVLLIRKNSVAIINETLTETLSKLNYLDLQGNDFSCDCDNAWFIDWAINNSNTQVLSVDQFKCNYPIKLRGSRLIDLDTEYCTVDVGLLCFISTTSFILVIVISSFFYHFLKWQVVYTYYLFLAFLYDKKQQEKQMLESFQYDAFISYNTHDELWVMQQLLPMLEEKQGWKLCLHHRDFQPGKAILDNIVDSIYNSRKTICVISRNYLESEWCSREIQVASFRLFDEKNDVLILVFLEEIPSHQLSPYYRMRSLIKKRTYLSWAKPEKETQQIFWEKLRVALETRGTSQ